MFRPHDLYGHGFSFSTFSPTEDDNDTPPSCCVCGHDCESRKYELPEGHLCDWHGTLLGLTVVDGTIPLDAGRVGT